MNTDASVTEFIKSDDISWDPIEKGWKKKLFVMMIG
jgi:hypothetical protein